MFPGLDLCYANPAQPLTTVGAELNDLDRVLSDLSIRGVKLLKSPRQRGIVALKRGTPAEARLVYRKFVP